MLNLLERDHELCLPARPFFGGLNFYYAGIRKPVRRINLPHQCRYTCTRLRDSFDLDRNTGLLHAIQVYAFGQSSSNFVE